MENALKIKRNLTSILSTGQIVQCIQEKSTT